MKNYRFKVVRNDGTHYFYDLGYKPIKEAMYSAYVQSMQDYKEVHLYADSVLIATFYHH